MNIPDSIEFKTAFLIAFGLVVDNGYSSLENIDEDDDPDDIRCDFDNALHETIERFNTLKHDAETLGELADIVLEVWTDLNEFLINTTDR